MKRYLILCLITLLALTINVTTGFAIDKSDDGLDIPIIVYGDTLNEGQREEVRRLLNVESLNEYREYDVTGEDISKYIGGDPDSGMYSSAKIIRKESGHGIVVNIVTADNITEVTNDMYTNAMLTAGVEDAIVEVASPVQVTGHSALTGIYKAYDAEGEMLDKERMEVANEELDVATKLSEREGLSEEKVTELLTEIKKAIADQDPATKEDIERIIKEQLDKLEISLSEEDRQLLTQLFDKMRDLNIDFDKVRSQLEDLTTTIKEKLDNIDFDDGFWEKVRNFFKELFNKLKALFD